MKRRNWEPLGFENLRTTSLFDRPSKVGVDEFAIPWKPGGKLSDFVSGLPSILAAGDFRQAVRSFSSAARSGHTILLGMGAHPIKVGLNPIIIDALERGLLTGIAMNGAGVIHDVELALAGRTSEDVAAHLDSGQFGTARETSGFIHGAVSDAHRRGGIGLGQAVGERLLMEKPPFSSHSILAAAARLEIPITVHVAIGTDIIHMHPAMDGAAFGSLSHFDFRLFCRLASSLRNGMYINLGSAVVLPEVFLKAISVARNLGYPVDGLTTLNMDFQRHYRATVNVVQRPTAGSGAGLTLIGHHEIMFPLLMAAVIDELSDWSSEEL